MVGVLMIALLVAWSYQRYQDYNQRVEQLDVALKQISSIRNRLDEAQQELRSIRSDSTEVKISAEQINGLKVKLEELQYVVGNIDKTNGTTHLQEEILSVKSAIEKSLNELDEIKEN